ncbi:MAG: TetR/AcrR family transcriptional regulator [Hamadaea sp.]|nr:TetR/AcrR family transcriptional regulator [Hamadaea sp.]
MTATGRRLRADAERSVQAILEAAERVLKDDPAATLEQIAEAAGVARTTVHRRFASRDALVAALAESAWRQIAGAVEGARPATAPPLVALHQATANILAIKSGWTFALGQPAATEEIARLQDAVFTACDQVFRRAQQAGVIREGIDLAWARQVYLALIDETVHGPAGGGDPDAAATRILDTLFHGVG